MSPLVFLQFLVGMCATDSLLSRGSCNTYCCVELGLLLSRCTKKNKRKEIKLEILISEILILLISLDFNN